MATVTNRTISDAATAWREVGAWADAHAWYGRLWRKLRGADHDYAHAALMSAVEFTEPSLNDALVRTASSPNFSVVAELLVAYFNQRARLQSPPRRRLLTHPQAPRSAGTPS
jgi:hypothetical protein